MQNKKKSVNQLPPDTKPVISRYGIKQHQKLHEVPEHDCKLCRAIKELEEKSNA